MLTSLPKVIWEEGRVAAHAKLYTYAGKFPLVTITRPQKYPFPWTDRQTSLSASSLDPPTYDAKRHPDPIRRFSTMHWTDRPTDRSSTGKFDDYRPLRSRATRPNNNEVGVTTLFCHHINFVQRV